MIVFFQLDITY